MLNLWIERIDCTCISVKTQCLDRWHNTEIFWELVWSFIKIFVKDELLHIINTKNQSCSKIVVVIEQTLIIHPI